MATTGKPPSSTSVTEPTLLYNVNTHQLRTYAHQAADPSFHLRILEALKEDHREIMAFGNLILKSSDPDEQTRSQNQFTWVLARHTVAEELVVYPAMERCVEGGREVADRDRGEHQKVISNKLTESETRQVKEQLKLFQALKPTDPRFRPTLESLLHDLRAHIHEEENTDISRLESALSQKESVGLSRALDRTKMFVPSRSHPLAPSRGPFKSAVGLMTAPIDYVADLFRKWPGGGWR